MKVDPFEAASFYLLYTLEICNTPEAFPNLFQHLLQVYNSVIISLRCF